MILPISASALAEIEPTWAISLLVVQGLESFFSSSTIAIDRLVDAALQVHRVHAGGNELHAFLHDRLRQHGRGGGAVAGDVGSLGSDFLHHLRAHVLELVLQLDFLGDRHAVLGDGRGAERALEHDVAALGAEGDLDRVGQDVDARDDRCVRDSLKLDVFCCHVWILLNALRTNGAIRLDDAHDVFFAHHEQFFAFDLDGLAGVLAEQDAVADLDVEREDLAVVVNLALADGHDFALVGLFGGGVGDHDAGGGLALFFQPLDDDAVVQRTNFHSVSKLNDSRKIEKTKVAAADDASYQHSLLPSAKCMGGGPVVQDTASRF